MSVMDEFQALTTSIGEYTVDTIGRVNLRGLQVTMDTRTSSASILVALRDNSDEQQKEALRALLIIEDIYLDEAVLSYRFVDEVTADGQAREVAPRFSFA